MTNKAPSIKGFHHITLPVHDLDTAEQYYCGLLGAELIERFDRETFLRYVPDRAHEVDNDNSPLHLSIRLGDSPQVDLFLQKKLGKRIPASHPHWAMGVAPSDLDAFILRLKNAGVPMDGPRRLGPPGHASVYFADPFGNLLEFVAMGYSGSVVLGPPDVSKLAW